VGRSYWIDLFTVETWQEFLDHGGDVSGFSEQRWLWARKIQPGDYLLCYLVRASRWIGVLEVTGQPYQDSTRIWKSKVFPSRVPVKVVVALTPETGVPVLSMRDQLSVFQELSNPNNWSGTFRGSPTRWKNNDGELVLAAVRAAAENPVHRPLGKASRRQRLQRVGFKTVTTGEDTVTVPEDEEPEAVADADKEPATRHTEIQFLLLKLGADMGFDVYVARNDQAKQWEGQRFTDMPHRRPSLPQQFDDMTNSVIALIDVLWLDGNAVVAAFEVESTTSIYSGLLRMSDLLSLQPNISVPLFLVAPDEWRDKVRAQVNRPTFKRLKPPLVEVCRYISFEGLRESVEAIRDVVTFLKPDYLQAISESLEAEPE
jgi:hypothetical protein